MSLFFIAVLRVLFLGGARGDEMIAGMGVLVLYSALLYQVWRIENLNLDLRLLDLA